MGTEILLENTALQQRKGGEMDPVQMDPYTFSRCIGKGLYEVKNNQGDVLKKKANINRLTVFKQREPMSTPEEPKTTSKTPGIDIGSKSVLLILYGIIIYKYK